MNPRDLKLTKFVDCLSPLTFVRSPCPFSPTLPCPPSSHPFLLHPALPLFLFPCRSLSSFSLVLPPSTNPLITPLTRLDDEIYAHTQSTFPELFVPPYDKLIKLDEEGMKSPQGKERWRVFIESLAFDFSFLPAPGIRALLSTLGWRCPM